MYKCPLLINYLFQSDYADANPGNMTLVSLSPKVPPLTIRNVLMLFIYKFPVAMKTYEGCEARRTSKTDRLDDIWLMQTCWKLGWAKTADLAPVAAINLMNIWNCIWNIRISIQLIKCVDVGSKTHVMRKKFVDVLTSYTIVLLLYSENGR